jgi:hypothetical protein
MYVNISKHSTYMFINISYCIAYVIMFKNRNIIAKKKINDKKKLIGDEYFIEVINVFHKLFDALVASRLILVTSNNILIFVSYVFSNKKQKKKLRCQAIVLDVLNYTCTCHSINPHIDFVHYCLIFFHWNTPLNLRHFEKFILVILDNITLCSSHPHRNKLNLMWPHDNKISYVEIYK